MKRLVYLIIILIPSLVKTQVASTKNEIVTLSGIQWENSLSWKLVQEKAMKENKFIFIDCYATWCKPCLAMDKQVYSDKAIGNFVNEHFISLKVQIDSTTKDNEFVKKWYADAHLLADKYEVSSLPTFLFFSPKGNLVHKEKGFRDTAQFLVILKDAINPQKQYFTLVENYRNGKMDYESMYELALAAYAIRDTSTSNKVARDYIDNYLFSLQYDQLLTKKNIMFIGGFAKNTTDKSFQWLYNNSAEINKIMENNDYVQSIIHNIITKEVIKPSLGKLPDNTPNWERISAMVTMQFGQYYADRTITDAKVGWFNKKKNWEEFTKYLVRYIENYGENMNDYSLSDNSWIVFLRSTNIKELKLASAWAERILNRSTDSISIIPNVLDTYANLKYKICYLTGDKNSSSDAIKIEEQALAIMVKNKQKIKVDRFQEKVRKMKNWETTWEEK